MKRDKEFSLAHAHFSERGGIRTKLTPIDPFFKMIMFSCFHLKIVHFSFNTTYKPLADNEDIMKLWWRKGKRRQAPFSGQTQHLLSEPRSDQCLPLWESIDSNNWLMDFVETQLMWLWFVTVRAMCATGVHFSLDVLLSWADRGSCAHKCVC